MGIYAINSVMVPTDFSTVAANALDTAIAICKRQLATLTLVHVVESAFMMLPPEGGGALGALLPKRLQDAEDQLDKIAKELRIRHDLVVSQIVRTGNPADEVCAIAAAKSIDLIVLGTHGASGLREFFAGSNAYRVVKQSACPVMTVPGGNLWPEFKRILFPIRLIPNALEKYEFVRPIIRKNDSQMLVAGVARKKDPKEFSELKSLVDFFRRQIAKDYVICDCELYRAENLARKVLEIADLERPDLIVITATLDTAIRDFITGPYARDIVNHSRFPVLSVRPQQKEHAAGTFHRTRKYTLA